MKLLFGLEPTVKKIFNVKAAVKIQKRATSCMVNKPPSGVHGEARSDCWQLKRISHSHNDNATCRGWQYQDKFNVLERRSLL